MPALPKTFYTSQQYVALERQADYKSELINGQIYAMSGASREHNLIAGNLFGELREQLKGKPCETYANDMRVNVHPTGLYTYPDVVVVCGEPAFEDEQVDTLLNPTVIIEVLSPSTEAGACPERSERDRGEKFVQYRRLVSLQEYVLAAQDNPRLEHYVRHIDDPNRWVLTEVSGLDGVLKLASIGCEVGLGDVYDRVNLPD